MKLSLYQIKCIATASQAWNDHIKEAANNDNFNPMFPFLQDHCRTITKKAKHRIDRMEYEDIQHVQWKLKQLEQYAFFLCCISFPQANVQVNRIAMDIGGQLPGHWLKHVLELKKGQEFAVQL